MNSIGQLRIRVKFLKRFLVDKFKVTLRYLSFIHRSFNVTMIMLICEGGYLVCVVLSNKDKLFYMKFDNFLKNFLDTLHMTVFRSGAIKIFQVTLDVTYESSNNRLRNNYTQNV